MGSVPMCVFFTRVNRGQVHADLVEQCCFSWDLNRLEELLLRWKIPLEKRVQHRTVPLEMNLLPDVARDARRDVVAVWDVRAQELDLPAVLKATCSGDRLLPPLGQLGRSGAGGVASPVGAAYLPALTGVGRRRRIRDAASPAVAA